MIMYIVLITVIFSFICLFFWWVRIQQNKKKEDLATQILRVIFPGDKLTVKEICKRLEVNSSSKESFPEGSVIRCLDSLVVNKRIKRKFNVKAKQGFGVEVMEATYHLP